MGNGDLEGKVDLPPGFRFFPTDEELVVHYLSNKVVSRPLPAVVIGEVDLYKYDPWQLPEKALFGEKEWYFFTPRDRKYPNGSRPNRAAGSGYWKATGADKPITSCGGKKRVGVKKALVFYKGKAPKGCKTNWIMHEYRMTEINLTVRKKGTLRLDDWVLCRIYNKKSSAEKLAEKKMMAETPAKEEMEDEKGEGNTFHLSPSVTAVASSSTDCALSSPAMNFSSEYQIPFYEPTSMTVTTTRPSPPPPLQLNSNTMQANNLNYAPTPFNRPLNDVQSSLKLGTFVPKQPSSHSLFNLSFNLEGLQNTNYVQFEQQTEGSLKNPYQEYIDSLYNLQRCYQGSDTILH
ncbi:hypothetical protein SUGI_0939960 [Cryptomeria japonica]|uniref:NAC domain-containing protein 2 n=1 Tax=Cryptomeria japonica TaxID=3369 RepID=UPI002414C1A9|nr:NAC domain-containing protein 2 [Cryptomeria japonica]GLJ44707.1 hypothetical protein SUGI_0939960 [Cryptomeria japonica]